MKKKILILANDSNYTYNLRRELIQQLLATSLDVILCFPDGPEVSYFTGLGCQFEPVDFKGRSIDVFSDFKLFHNYLKILKKIKPDVVLTYTIKPNVYGGLACKLLNLPVIANITGLGSALEKNGVLQQIGILLYKAATGKRSTYFFQNSENQSFFAKHHIQGADQRLIPGSGVNINYFRYLPYPDPGDVHFCYIARIMKEKGIDLYIESARRLTAKYKQAKFHVVGRINPEYVELIDNFVHQGMIEYHGEAQDVRTIIERMHCIVHPSYYPEGLSNILLESAASGRPIITTDRSGCREVVKDRISGFVVKLQDVDDLTEKMEMFLQLPYEQQKAMGQAGREHVSQNFSREHVVKAYIEKIENILK